MSVRINQNAESAAEVAAPTPERWAAILTGVGPVLLLAAFLWHPPIPGRLPDDAAVAEAAAADLTRWGLAHFAAVLASAAIAVAFVAVREYLRAHGDRRPSALGLGAVVVGSVLYAVLPGLEFAHIAAHETGADMEAAQAALREWFLVFLLGGSLVFLLGCAAFAVAVMRTRPLGGRLDGVVAGALIVFALARLVPIGAVQFYVQSAAALLALLPLAVGMWGRTKTPGS
jgi:hypothetical protein